MLAPFFALRVVVSTTAKDPRRWHEKRGAEQQLLLRIGGQQQLDGSRERNLARRERRRDIFFSPISHLAFSLQQVKRALPLPSRRKTWLTRVAP